jgi:hypothetical protein
MVTPEQAALLRRAIANYRKAKKLMKAWENETERLFDNEAPHERSASAPNSGRPGDVMVNRAGSEEHEAWFHKVTEVIDSAIVKRSYLRFEHSSLATAVSSLLIARAGDRRLPERH